MGLRCRACQPRTLELNHGLPRRLPRLCRDTLTQLLRNRIIPKCKDRDLYKYKQLVFIIIIIFCVLSVCSISFATVTATAIVCYGSAIYGGDTVVEEKEIEEEELELKLALR